MHVNIDATFVTLFRIDLSQNNMWVSMCNFFASFYCKVAGVQIFDVPFDCDIIMKKSANKCMRFVMHFVRGQLLCYLMGKVKNF